MTVDSTPAPSPTPASADAERPSSPSARPPRWWATVAIVLAAVALAAVWPLAWVHRYGDTTAVLGAGEDGPSRALIAEEIPHAVAFPSWGHDGQQFYAIARSPFDPPEAREHLDWPAYRYRRILFPLLAGALAPGGGEALLVAFAAVSLAGVALGAWATTRLPGAPRWLPLSLGLNPGVGVALLLSLSDALATGLTVAAVAAAARRRWAAMVLAATAAALTRETLVVVGLGLVLTPGLARRWRVAVGAIPIGALAAWSLWSAHALGTPITEGSGQVSPPFLGWLEAGGSTVGILFGFLALVLLALGAWRAWPEAPHLAAILGAQAVLVACLSPLVTVSWFNTGRVIAPMFPLALWVVFRQPSAEAGDPSDAAAATQEDSPEPAPDRPLSPAIV